MTFDKFRDKQIKLNLMKRYTLLFATLVLIIALFAIAQDCWADGPPPPPPGGGHGGGGTQPPGGGVPIDDGLPLLLLAIASYGAYKLNRLWHLKG
jgi:hypothetical protein